jgi:hypothetical protein
MKRRPAMVILAGEVTERTRTDQTVMDSRKRVHHNKENGEGYLLVVVAED